MENGSDARKGVTKKLSVTAAVFFIVGDIVGAGVVTLPYTMKLVSWWGIPLFFLSALLMCLCGILLSKGCLIAFDDNVNRDELRDPYPQLAEKSFGKTAKHSVSVILNVSLVFTCIIFLLLIGEILTQFAPLPVEHISYRNQLRLWFATCGVVLVPLTLLGTPKDFSGVGFLATTFSFTAAILILLNIAMTSHKVGFTLPKRFKVDIETMLAAFGTIQFTFGGIVIFPTIQNDLEHPEQFPFAVMIGYCIVFVIYTSVSTTAFIVLDLSIQEDILSTFTSMPLYSSCVYFRTYVILAQIMICGHVLCAFVMLVNPINQQMESLLKAPIHFGWKRVAIRSSIVVIVVVIASVVPNFGPVLSLAGGSFFSLLSVIFPILFYCKLADKLGLIKELFLGAVIVISIASAFGNGYVEVKNVIDVIRGTYKQTR